MHTKHQRAVTLFLCTIFILITFFSLFLIVKEEKHQCSGADCPVCASIHQAEQNLKNLATSTVLSSATESVIWSAVLILCGLSFFVFCTSLIKQKVRLND